MVAKGKKKKKKKQGLTKVGREKDVPVAVSQRCSTNSSSSSSDSSDVIPE